MHDKKEELLHDKMIIKHDNLRIKWKDFSLQLLSENPFPTEPTVSL